MSINGKNHPNIIDSGISKQTITKKTVEVALAVLRFGDEFLLAVRHSHQHQGGKLEFVGGAVLPNESATTALVREVKEELRLDIDESTLVKMGNIYHDYGDKAVHLRVFEYELTLAQYEAFKNKNHGNEGQLLKWCHRAELLMLASQFPAANAEILTWLQLPKVVIISHALSEFVNEAAWVDFYASNLPKNCTFYVRPEAPYQAACYLVSSLASRRDDVSWILPWEWCRHISESTDGGFDEVLDRGKVLALRLSHRHLNEWANCQNDGVFFCADNDVGNHINHCADSGSLANKPILVSCHDEHSVQMANDLRCRLAKANHLMGVFISPVKSTKTHPEATALGWQDFSSLANMSDTPVLALGGLTMEDLTFAQTHGAWGVSGIRGFVNRL